MLIVVASSDGVIPVPGFAVNLACELAGVDKLATDRWQGRHSVVLVDSDPKGAATVYCSGGNLPVSGESLSLEDSKDIEHWTQRMRATAAEVDYVVVDGIPHVRGATNAVIGHSDLVLIPCPASEGDLAAILPMIELVRVMRSGRSDGGPKCLLVPTHTSPGTLPGSELEAALRKLDEPVAPAIHETPVFADALNQGRWIGDFAAGSPAHNDFKALVASVEQTLADKSAGGAPKALALRELVTLWKSLWK